MLTVTFNRLSEKFLVKDTSNFLRKINTVEFAPNNSYLVSLDVKSLKTNIPNGVIPKVSRL